MLQNEGHLWFGRRRQQQQQAISCLHSTHTAERAHATTNRSFSAHYTTHSPTPPSIHPWPMSPYRKRPGPGSPDRKDSHGLASRLAHAAAEHITRLLARLLSLSPTRTRFPRLPFPTCRGARQSRVSPPFARRSAPAGHVEARCVRIVVSSLPPSSDRVGSLLLFRADWLFFPPFSRVLTRRLGFALQEGRPSR